MTAYTKNKKAYSLIELSMVIIIMALMVSSGMALISNSLVNSKTKITKERLDAVYKALGAYLISNKSLPCPAPINALRSSSANYGDATGAAGSCVVSGVLTRGTGLVYGMVPVQDLNLDSSFAEDGFGNKFIYVVAQAFTNPVIATGFATASETNIITIKDKVTTSTEQVVTTDAIFVLMSYGVNKFGAYPINSATQNAAPSDSEELINYGSTNNFFINSITSDVFDDIVFFKTRNEMVADFDAYNLVACKAGAAQTIYGVSYTWPPAQYGENAVANQECPTSPVNYKLRNARPIKRCGPFGIWESDLSTPCYNS